MHRAISPDLPLLFVALEEEATQLQITELPVLVTGAGKVNAAVAVATLLGAYSPSLLINLDTAGALPDGLSGTNVVSRVARQADLVDIKGYAIAHAESAGKSWSESVDECSAQLGAWVRANVLH